MLRYLLDTVTYVHVMRAEPGSKLAGRLNRFSRQVAISTITLAELHHGAERSQRPGANLAEIQHLITALEAVLDFDSAAAIEFGRTRAALRRQPIGPLDTLIAAHALSRNLIVVTDNVREFGRVPGLQIENWVR